MNLKIETLPISSIRPYDRNARKHQDEDVSAIVASIEEFGFNDPIGVWSKDNIIVEGHGRLLAAKKLGMKEVPCIRLDHLSDEERRAYALAHNKTAELSLWDWDKLDLELKNIEDIDMTVFGFEIDEEDPETVDDDYEVELPDEPVAKRGDIYQLGKHRLMCGDSTMIDDVDKLMNGELADAVFTDPPWNVNYGTQDHPSWKGGADRQILNDFMGTEEFKQFMHDAFSCMNMASKPGAMTYVVMSAQEWGNMMLTLAENN